MELSNLNRIFVKVPEDMDFPSLDLPDNHQPQLLRILQSLSLCVNHYPQCLRLTLSLAPLDNP